LWKRIEIVAAINGTAMPVPITARRSRPASRRFTVRSMMHELPARGLPTAERPAALRR
jgi:hypothetical protein